MKKHYTLLAVAVLVLSLFACQKEQVEIVQPTSRAPLTAQEKLDKLSLPIILFQYSFVDLETGEETGWIVDRSGNVRTYAYSRSAGNAPSSGNETWQESDLANFYALASETVATIEAEELLTRAHQGLGLSKRFLSGTETRNDASWVSGFYAFTQSEKTSGSNGASHNSCYGAPDYTNNIPTDSKIDRMIINLSGRLNRYETSNYATNLHQWLLNLNEGL